MLPRAKPFTPVPKQDIVRDRKYLDDQFFERCLLTGRYGDDNETVDPMHIGTGGKGLKIGDDMVIPVTHSLHALAHQKGEISMLREYAPDDVLREAFRALARERYEKWRREHEK